MRYPSRPPTLSAAPALSRARATPASTLASSAVTSPWQYTLPAPTARASFGSTSSAGTSAEQGIQLTQHNRDRQMVSLPTQQEHPAAERGRPCKTRLHPTPLIHLVEHSSGLILCRLVLMPGPGRKPWLKLTLFLHSRSGLASPELWQSCTQCNMCMAHPPGLPVRTTRSLPASLSLLLRSDRASRMNRARYGPVLSNPLGLCRHSTAQHDASGHVRDYVTPIDNHDMTCKGLPPGNQ